LCPRPNVSSMLGLETLVVVFGWDWESLSPCLGTKAKLARSVFVHSCCFWVIRSSSSPTVLCTLICPFLPRENH
jgi:hypothetical protein